MHIGKYVLAAAFAVASFDSASAKVLTRVYSFSGVNIGDPFGCEYINYSFDLDPLFSKFEKINSVTVIEQVDWYVRAELSTEAENAEESIPVGGLACYNSAQSGVQESFLEFVTVTPGVESEFFVEFELDSVFSSATYAELFSIWDLQVGFEELNIDYEPRWISNPDLVYTGTLSVTVEGVPVPSSLAVFASALLAGCGVRRGQRSVSTGRAD